MIPHAGAVRRYDSDGCVCGHFSAYAALVRASLRGLAGAGVVYASIV